jgi:hypothetical protein
MKGTRAMAALALVFAMSCGGSGGTPGTAASNAPAASASSAAAPIPAATTGATNAPSAAGAPSFKQILSSAKLTEYKVTYKLTASGQGEAFSGEQSWYFKPPRSRFDFSSTVSGQKTTVSLFSLTDGTYMCFTDGGQAQCLGMGGVDTALQSNTAAQMQESLVDHPEQFDGVLVETRTIAGQQAHCYDVRALAAQAAGLTTGRFCYSAQGIPLLSKFSAATGDWAMEATNLSTSVPESDFTLPAKPTTLGRP